MNIVIFTHPPFSKALSIDKYTNMLVQGLRAIGHIVEVQTAEEYFYKIPAPKFLKKWLGYLDQFLIFPLKFRQKKYSVETLFVFADQALGPWIPLVANRPHIIHCHDFLAQRSALNDFSGNKVSFTGKIYQRLIRNGYSRGKNFISISSKTQKDLHHFLGSEPLTSEVVYNGLNLDFKPGEVKKVRHKIEEMFNLNLREGYILHIGGNQFYKNRKGVVKIYDTWRTTFHSKKPLIMIGPEPPEDLLNIKSHSRFSSEIHFFTNISDDLLQYFYQGASILLFPSQEEGFGWPIAEAMASGCPVITTNKAPMNEVGGKDCIYIPSCPPNKELESIWLNHCAKVLENYLNLSQEARQELIELGLANSRRFNTEEAVKNIEKIYHKILESYNLTIDKVVIASPDPQP